MRKWIFILILVLLSGLPVPLTFAENTSETNGQLEINKNALLTGPDESIRLKAADLILKSSESEARTMLLDTFKNNKNQPAQLAICKALSQARNNNGISNKKDFIEPLLTFLSKQTEPAATRFVTEAFLVFQYEDIEKPLLNTITNENLDIKTRLNALKALQLQPDIRAIVRLIELLESPQAQIVTAAGKALTSLGIPAVDADWATRKQIINDIQRIGKEEFLRYWQIREGYEKQLKELQDESDFWMIEFFGSLELLYDKISSDEDSRIKFLDKYLNGKKPPQRIWALLKLSEWWVGTGPKSKVLTGLGPSVIKLISDNDTQVRLNAAKLITLLGELNSAGQLLEQIKQEKDEQVKQELFFALGQACRYAFSPQSKIKLDEAIRIETLDLAAGYLLSEKPEYASKGAEVIRNLLEHNGLKNDIVNKYLYSLSSRYSGEKTPDKLRGDLLDSMAILCGQSAYKESAAAMYKRIFDAALSENNSRVRAAAVTGLININKFQALQQLRKDFVNDENPGIRIKLITLANEVGQIQDIEWLVNKINQNSEGAAAWKAMLKIFEDSNSKELFKWLPKLQAKNATKPQQIALLEIIERKAESENNASVLKQAQTQLADLYKQNNQLDKSAEYLGILIKKTKDKERDQFTADLLSIYLKGQKTNPVRDLLAQKLLEKDIDNKCPIGKRLAEFTSQKSEFVTALLAELGKTKLPEKLKRPGWDALLKQLTEANAPKEALQPKDPNAPASKQDPNK